MGFNRWIAKNAFLNSKEQEHNAAFLWDALRRDGWTEEAAAAVLGNVQAESTINPGIWENLTPNIKRGFGLVQWTPSYKLTDWIHENFPGTPDDDGDAQVARILYERARGYQWSQQGVKPPYAMSFEEFATSNKPVKILTGAWLKCYERPVDQSEAVVVHRAKFAARWYEKFTGRKPAGVLPVWLLFKFNER